MILDSKILPRYFKAMLGKVDNDNYSEIPLDKSTTFRVYAAAAITAYLTLDWYEHRYKG
jgi:hypothetical protein